jgi:hypothetical protein
MRIELRIGRLVADDLGGCATDDFVAAVTRELRLVLVRELAGPRPAAGRTRSVPQVRAAVTLPAAGATGVPAGRAVGAALGAAVTSERVFPRSRRGPR